MSDGWFVPVPRWLLSRSDVSWGAKVLFGVLSRYARRSKAPCAAIETLSEDMGKAPRRTVQSWLKELTDAGLVSVERTGRASVYRVASGREQGPEDAPDRCAEDCASDTQESAQQTREPPRISDANLRASEARGVAHHAQVVPITRDQDKNKISLDQRGGESESDHAARVALQAYVAAEESAGSLVQWTTGSAYAQLVLVHRLAVAQAERTGQPALEVLAAWARRYVGERHKRHPRWWADCVNDWLAAPAKVAVVERKGSLPVATREQLLADAADEDIR